MSATLEIQKGVPMPSLKRGRNPGEILLTMRILQVGDSFVIPTKKATNISAFAKNCNGMKFSVRKESKDTTRVWRTK